MECVRNRSRSETQCKARQVAGLGGRAKSARRPSRDMFSPRFSRFSVLGKFHFASGVDDLFLHPAWSQPGSLQLLHLKQRHNGDRFYAQPYVNVLISPIPSLALICTNMCSANIAKRHCPWTRLEERSLLQPEKPGNGCPF